MKSSTKPFAGVPIPESPRIRYVRVPAPLFFPARVVVSIWVFSIVAGLFAAPPIWSASVDPGKTQTPNGERNDARDTSPGDTRNDTSKAPSGDPLKDIRNDPLLAGYSSPVSGAPSNVPLTPPTPPDAVLAVFIPFQLDQADGANAAERRGRFRLGLGIAEVLETVLRRRWQALPGTSLLPKDTSLWRGKGFPETDEMIAMYPHRDAILSGRINVLPGKTTPDRVHLTATLIIRDRKTGKHATDTFTIDCPPSELVRRIDLGLMPWLAGKTGLNLSEKHVADAMKLTPENDEMLGELMVRTSVARMPTGMIDTPNIRLDRVRKTFEPLIAQAGKSPLIWSIYANLLEGDEDKQLDALASVTRVDPYYIDAWVKQAAIQRRRGDNKAALKRLQRALLRCPYDGAALMAIQLVRNDLAHAATSREAYRRHAAACSDSIRLAASLMPDNPDALNVLGADYLDHGDIEKAATIFQAVLKRDPGNLSCALYYKNVLALNGRFEEAIGLIRDHAAMYSDNETVWMDLGELFDAIGKFDSANKAYSRALKLSFLGRRRDFYLRLAESRFMAGAMDDAIALLDEGIARGVKEDEPVLPYELMKYRFTALKKRGGIPEYQLKPDKAAAYWRAVSRAEYLLNWNDTSRGENAITRALAILPDGLYALRWQAIIYYQKNLSDDMSDAVNRVLGLGDPAPTLRAVVLANRLYRARANNDADAQQKLIPAIGDYFDAMPPLHSSDHSESDMPLLDYPSLLGWKYLMNNYIDLSTRGKRNDPALDAQRDKIKNMLSKLTAVPDASPPTPNPKPAQHVTPSENTGGK